MDIATAKPSAREQASIPHHLIDIVRPDEEFTLPDFLEKASSAITGIRQRGSLPLLVGGTVLYINALLEGWQVPVVAPDLELRRRLENEAVLRGSEALFQDLLNIDPQAAGHINPFNVRRIVRALEVNLTTGLIFKPSIVNF